MANTILNWKKNYFGQPVINIKSLPVNKRYNNSATIARTNLVLLDNAIQYIQNNSDARIYFEGNINSYTYADESGTSVYDVLHLSNGAHNLIKDKLVKKMANLDELIEYVEKTEDAPLGMIIEMVTKYGNELPDLIVELKQKHLPDNKRQESDMIFSTVHRCKGMEYDTVYLCDDFITEDLLTDALKDSEITKKKKQQLAEEVNILYVACTRVKSKLCMPTNINPFDTIQFAFPGDKIDKKYLASRLRNIESIEELKKVIIDLGLNDNKPLNHGKKWESNELKTLKKFFENGQSKEFIANHLQRTTSSIELKLESMGKFFS